MRKGLNFVDDESGSEIVEWVVVAIILLVAVVAGLSAVSGQFVQNVLDTVRAGLKKVVG
jgi:Flp pilus assembly pilin Flp